MFTIKEKATVVANGVKWEVLKRTGNAVLIEGMPKDVPGPKRWDVCFVYTEDDNEIIKPNFYEGSHDSPTFNKGLMEATFAKAVRQAESNRRVHESMQKEEAEKSRLETIWRAECEGLHLEQAVLIEKLKALTKGQRNILDNKKVVEIGQRLMTIDAILHHGKPRV